MIFNKDDVYTSDNKVQKLSREFKIYYRACIVELVYLLSKIVYFSFAVQELATFSSNPGKVHLLRYIRDNNTLGLKYYADMKDAHLSELLRQAIIKTDNQLMVFHYSSWKGCPDTDRSTGACIIFYQVGPIDHGTHVPGPVAQSSTEIEYNTACTAGMDLAYLRILIHEFLNMDSNIVPEAEPPIILYSKSSVCMDKNSKYTKHTSHIARRVNFVRNGENFIMHKIKWCEVGLQLA